MSTHTATTTAQKTRATIPDLEAAALSLSMSDKGRAALQHLRDWLYRKGGGVSLDRQNQLAAMILLDGAWGQYAGTTRDIINDALGD